MTFKEEIIAHDMSYFPWMLQGGQKRPFWIRVVCKIPHISCCCELLWHTAWGHTQNGQTHAQWTGWSPSMQIDPIALKVMNDYKRNYQIWLFWTNHHKNVSSILLCIYIQHIIMSLLGDSIGCNFFWVFLNTLLISYASILFLVVVWREIEIKTSFHITWGS